MLTGYQETPSAVSTTGVGAFAARISNDESRIDWELTYADLEGAVQQAHVHFGQKGVVGPISVFLCTNLGTDLRELNPVPCHQQRYPALSWYRTLPTLRTSGELAPENLAN
jgi:hypothetical protein